MNEKGSKRVSAESTKSKQKTHKHKKPRSKGMRIFLKVLSTAGKALATLFLVGVITGCIVVTALTVYLMKFSDDTNYVDIESYKSSNAIIYATDTTGTISVDDLSSYKWEEVGKITNGKNQQWVDYNDIPQHVIDAFRCTEDVRFFDHDGVDWKRTFASFANLFLHFYDTRQGGSTITQQTIKVITGDDDASGLSGISRKIREIFRALNTEKKVAKPQIMECYLNIINLGNGTWGVQAASKYYFGKDVQDLTIAEAASLAATAKSPSNYNIKDGAEINEQRRENYTLKVMLEERAITQEEYDTAMAEDVKAVEDPEIANEENQETQKAQSYFIDEVYREVTNDLMEEYGWNKQYAENILKNSGLKIYTTMNPDVQDILEEKYLDPLTFASKSNVKDPPQSAMVIYDLAGHMRAVVGGRGEKPGALTLNRATQSTVGIGSSIKPLSTYALAIDKNFVTWSTLIEDKPTLKRPDGTLYPKNSPNRSYGMITIQKAIERSLNTIPVRLIREQITREASFDFMVNKLGITTLVKSKEITNEDGSTETVSDIDYARLAMGSLVNGMKLSELANAYQIFANGGYYNESTTYLRVEKPDGTVLLESKANPLRAISEESAGVMNKLLQQVIEGPNGTGTRAKMSNQVVIGKTGTQNDGKSLAFLGITPYYIGAVWVGYDTPKDINTNTHYRPVQIWKNVMTDVHKNLSKKEFELSPNIKQLQYCTKTGMIASDKCTSKATGYYKSDNIPATCSGNH